MTVSQQNLALHIDTSEAIEREGFVFISYKNEEAALAERIRSALKKAGFSVWWDRQIQCGQAWNEVLDDAVKQASCVVVLWSPLSTESKWVLHEASVALARDNYAPARIQLCSIPTPYNQLQATDIIDWDGVSDHPGVRNLLNRCDALVPKRRSSWSQFTGALWTHRRSALAFMFGGIALTTLAWQTNASRSQLRQLDSIVSQQTDSSVRLDQFQKQSGESVRSQLQQLDALISQQTEASTRLNTLASQQTEASASLDEFRRQAERDTLRGYYRLEPLTIEFTLEYPFAHKEFAAYAKRLRPQLNRYRNKDVLINIKHPDLKDLLPGRGQDEEYAERQLLSDQTAFKFVDTKQAVDSDSRSFVRKHERGRGVIQFNSIPQSLADAIVKLPSSGKIEQEIELWADPNGEKFIKKVRCKNPVRTGDDVYAFSVIDLLGRIMRYEADDDARLADFRFKFSFDYDSYSHLNSTITFPEGVREMVITPQHVGLQKYAINESVRSARERFDRLPPSQKRTLLDVELKRRLDLFVKTFIRMESDNTWSLARWAKVEWTANALDGNPPFGEQIYADPAFEGRSFKWLLAELSRTTKGTDRKVAAGIRGANNLFELLAAIGPETSNDRIDQTLKEVRERIFSDFGLGPWKPDTSF